jgi:hypothetical protein
MAGRMVLLLEIGAPCPDQARGDDRGPVPQAAGWSAAR